MDKREFNKRIGKNIKRIRSAQKIKQNSLAEGIGVIPETISKIERGLYVPPLQLFYDICEFINASPNEILYRDARWREWKEENPLYTDYSVSGLVDIINISEDLWAKADLCHERNDKQGEMFYLDSIIQMCLRGEGLDFYTEKMIPDLLECKDKIKAFRELANNIYKSWLNSQLDKIIEETRRNKISNLKLTEEKKRKQENL